MMNSSDTDSDPQTVVVTGASSGIGKETALRYAGRGARIVLAARSELTLHRVAEECLAAGAAEVIVQATDIVEVDQVQRLFDTAVARFGRVDIAIQCAAITAFGRFEDLPVDVFDGIVRTNILGAANVARCALIHFQSCGSGHLVLIGSLLGVTAAPYQSPYVVSKFAVTGPVRLLRQENQHFPGIKVHGVYPGPVDTPGLRHSGQLLRPLSPCPAHSGPTGNHRRRNRPRYGPAPLQRATSRLDESTGNLCVPPDSISLRCRDRAFPPRGRVHVRTDKVHRWQLV